MKYNFDSYMLYQTGKMIRNVIRVKVTMKYPIDLKILRTAVNTATERYPYFKKRVTVNAEGAYILEDNPLPIVVIPTQKKAPAIGCAAVNHHLLYVDAEDNTIYFCISHTLAGGKGVQPWLMTCLWQYVTDKFHVNLSVPGLRKPDSPLLPTELSCPTYERLTKEKPIYEPACPKAVMLLGDYLNGFVNPFAKREEYYLFTFNQADFMKYCRATDSSVASLFSVLLFKAFDRILPKKASVIRAMMAHNPCNSLGIPDAHCDIRNHIHVDYNRELAGYSMEKLGTITRGQMILQMDPSCAAVGVRKILDMIEGIDSVQGLKQKRKYAKRANQSLGKGALHGTYYVNYTGYTDWGDLANYVESSAAIVDGHMVTEVSAVGDKIFLAPMALVNEEKYIKALSDVLGELKIPYKLEGPFPKNLPYQEFPRA